MPSNVLQIGNVQITAVLDASASVPASVAFPATAPDQWAPYPQHWSGERHVLPLSMTSFLVRAGGKTILIDTGMGAKDRPFFPNGRLPDALAEAGVSVDDIDIVAVTHIHVDHVGGHTKRAGDAWVPAFPKAKHLFVQQEWDYWTQPDVANAPANPYVLDCVLPLDGAVDIDLVSSDHRLTDEITLLPTPGHTPAHTSYLISSAGQSAVILGDVAHSPVQVTENWSGIFDLDPVMAATTRDALMRRLADEGHLLAAGHFPHPGFGRIVQVEGKRHWRAL
ncbi:MAG TPA: MBL fold metallo-hydrolase [Dehalococcoidia bacterium]|nr:MBL fold metallo-hydrolase [Dehalococcoidia bacterium]